MLETTGLADPGNIAPLFWLDEGLGSSIFLDGIVTLVDASNIIRSLEDRRPIQSDDPEEKARPEEGLTTAHLQISHADVVVINKQDLVTEDELVAVKKRIESINGVARVIVTERGKVGNIESWLLDQKAYEKVEDLKVTERSLLDPVEYPRFSISSFRSPSPPSSFCFPFCFPLPLTRYPFFFLLSFVLTFIVYHDGIGPATAVRREAARPAGRMAQKRALGRASAVSGFGLRDHRRSSAERASSGRGWKSIPDPGRPKGF